MIMPIFACRQMPTKDICLWSQFYTCLIKERKEMKEETCQTDIVAVVVTYNRLKLLKETLAALRAQTHPVRKTIVIDNHSTDGTEEFLEGFRDDPQTEILRTAANIGGAGGFAEGIRRAAHEHAEWIWLMDDDTVPADDALERMMPFTEIDSVGFINSRVVWTDGTTHIMNEPGISGDKMAKRTLFEGRESLAGEAEIISQASFVSLLIRGKVPWEIGLPYREFFIWRDDSEYTWRMTERGYCGVLATRSVAVHKTAENYGSSLADIPASAAWKLYYGERNESFMRRKVKGRVAFLFSQLNAIRLHARRIKRRNLPEKDERKLLRASRKGLTDGLFFNPRVEFP